MRPVHGGRMRPPTGPHMCGPEQPLTTVAGQPAPHSMGTFESPITSAT